ncbi:MAG: sensor histidine kinase [Lysobacter sp.]
MKSLRAWQWLRLHWGNFSILVAALAVAVSVAGLLVWQWRVSLLDGDLSVEVVPSPAAGWATLFAGLALWLRSKRLVDAGDRRRRWSDYLALCMATLVLVTGLMALIGHQVFDAAGPTLVGPMGANSALVFCLLGVALIVLDVTTHKGRRPAEIAALAAMLASVTALVGYAYGVSSLYTVANSDPMVLPTAALTFLLAVGILCARPTIGIMALATGPGFAGTLLRRLLPTSLLTLFAMGWLRMESERRQLYSTELGVAVFTIASIVVATLLVWWSARTMQRLEQQRAVSEQRRAKAVALNTLIMEKSLDVLCVINAAGRFLRVSSAAQALWGYSPAELEGRPYADMVDPDDRERTAEVFIDIMAGRPAGGLTNRCLLKDGSFVAIDWSAAWSEPDQLMFCVARDATQRLQMAETLRRGAEDLAQTNQELESFTYSVSHDLRAPLRHINGYARMLEEDGGDRLDGELRRYLDEIGASARRMGRLIDDLLAFSRLGRQTVSRREVDMADLVGDALRGIAADQPVAAMVSVGPLPVGHADPSLLKQVWINLLANALKYSGNLGADARIEVSGESDGTVTRYSVRDNGVGFDMRYVSKLFQVFQRLHLQDDFEGTGVGLAIVQRIVSRHGGKVWAQGEPGKGATFTFELPVTAIEPERISG